MLTRAEFKTCLEEAEFSKKQTESILQKNIDKILSKRNIDEIKGILEALKVCAISKDRISESLLLFSLGKAEEIVPVYQCLREHKVEHETIEGCLTVLARGRLAKNWEAL